MDPVMMTVDLAAGVMAAVLALRERMDAARNLPERARRVRQTLEQVEGAIEGVQEDRQTKSGLQAIRDSLVKMADLVAELDALSTGPEYSGPLSSALRCLCLLSQGHDVMVLERELESLNEEVRQELHELVKATQLHSYASRSSGVLRGEQARKFWDTHFSNQREVGLAQLGEALKFEAEQQALGIDWPRLWSTCRRLLLKERGDDDAAPVSVLRFGEVFGAAPLSETLQRLSERATAPTQLVKVRVFRMPGAVPDRSVDLGAVLVRTTDSLAIFRSLLKEHASSPEQFSDEEDEEEDMGSVFSGGGSKASAGASIAGSLDESLKFVRDGQFMFFLDDCTVRVRRRQERSMAGLEYLTNCAIVRSTDLPMSAGAKKGLSLMKGVALMKGATDAAGSRHQSEASSSEIDKDEQVDFSLLAMEEMARADAAGLTLERVLNEPQLLQKLKAAANRSGVGEDAVALLDHERQLSNALSSAAPPGGGFSAARLRRARVGFRAIAERFFAAGSTYQLPLTDAEVAAVFGRWKEADESCVRARPGGDQELLASFVPALEKVRALLEPLVGKLAKGMAAPGRVKEVKGKGAGKIRVVVVGGGYSGCVVAKFLDADTRFHVVLVDPKEYFEDATAMPKAVVNPGSSPQDEKGRWPQIVARYKGATIMNGSIVYGLCTGITRTHVEVGAFRRCVPYDFAVIATGSSYTSSIKTQNPSLSFRWRQMAQERSVLEKCKRIIVVGGGLTGCEFAGDIAETFPQTRVTLIQRNDKLLPHISGAHEKVAPILEALGVRVMTNCDVRKIDHMSGTVEISHGAILEAERILNCSGATPNTDFMRDPNSDPSAREALDADGFIRVSHSLKVNGLENVYACGDILSGGGGRFFDSLGETGGPVERRAACAMAHGYVAAMNIIRSAEGSGEASLLRYDEWLNGFGGAGASAFISLGSKKGLAKVPAPKLPIYKGMGFDLDHQHDTLVKDGCCVDEAIQGMKDGVSAMVLGCATNYDFLQGMSGTYFQNLPQIIDPVKSQERYLESVTAKPPYETPAPEASASRNADRSVAFADARAEKEDLEDTAGGDPVHPDSANVPVPEVAPRAGGIDPSLLEDLQGQARDLQSELWTLREKHNELGEELAQERKESELTRAELTSAREEMSSVREELAVVKASLASPRGGFPPSSSRPYPDAQPPHAAWASEISDTGGSGAFASRAGPGSVPPPPPSMHRAPSAALSSGGASVGDTVLAAANFIQMLATQVKKQEDGRFSDLTAHSAEDAPELPGQLPGSAGEGYRD